MRGALVCSFSRFNRLQPRRTATLCYVLILFLLFVPLTGRAFAGIEKDLQNIFVESRTLAHDIKTKLSQGSSVTSEIAQLKASAENIRVNDLLLQERFKQTEEKAKSLGTRALSRQQTMTDGYKTAITEYLGLVDSLPSGAQSSTRNSKLATTVQQLLDLFDKLFPKRKKRLIGSLPYKHLNYPSQTPSSSAAITPAYLGGNKTVSSDDTRSTEEAPVSKTIADLAQSLKWQPVLIYEHIKNSIETDWGYWGCMKGAEETLRQKSGSSCDQALLISSLLKASGYPTRIVRATIQFFGGGKTKPMDRAKHLTGLDDPWKIAELFQKAGIPFTPVITGGAVSNIQFDHIFIETQVPWANYRGLAIDNQGLSWQGLDTSIKVKGYNYNSPSDILDELSLSNIRDEYLSLSLNAESEDPQPATPLEYLQSSINTELATRNTQTYSDFLQIRTLISEVMNILPGSMQFTLVKATNEYTEIPDELKHKVKFTAKNPQSGTTLFEITLPLYKLSNQQIAVTYEPETVEDQQTIDSYGGLDNTPAYLVRLRPVLTINKERIIVAADGLPMGEEFDLTIELISPNSTESITNTHTVGNLSVIGITAQKTVAGYGAQVTGDKDAERLLYEEAMNYIDRWNQAEDELGSLLHLAIARPMPTVVTVGGVIDVTYLLDMPHEFNWKGLYLDADLRRIETVTGYGATGSGITSEEREKLFMQLSSLQGSVLENRIFEDDFEVESISTAKLFQAVNTQPDTSQPATGTTIDKNNIDSILPTLSLDDSIKEDITNSVNQNFTVLLPATRNSQPGTDVVYQDWTGIGYLKENAETGESGWMLSGMIAGGMTAWSLDKWPDYYASLLSNPYSEPANEDPASAQSIRKITAGDLQTGTVGTQLAKPLQVKVYDQDKKPVKNAEVTFTVKAGGGKLGDNLATSATVTTDSKGIASVKLTLGQKTSDNPTFWWYDDSSKPMPDQAGENIVDATLSSGTGITTPFTAYGLPGPAANVNKVYGDGTWGMALSFAGFVSVSVQDNYGNPVSNVPVTFTAADPVQNPDEPNCAWTSQDTRKTYLLYTSESCLSDAPTWGTCGDSLRSSLTITTDYTGAAAQVILGGMEDAKYAITASALTFTNSFTLYTYDLYALYNRSCDNTKDPIRQLKVAYTYATDQYGNNIVSGKTGSTIPVRAKMYSLVEGETLKDVSFACSTGTITCSAITGNRQYDTTNEYTSSSVLFSSGTGTDQGNGIYTADYILKSGVNTITIEGTGTLDVQSTTGCPACSTVTTPLTQTDQTTMTVYGVDIQFGTIPVILVDQERYAEQDYSITYTITPREYTAGSAYTVIYKNNEPVAYLYTEKQGSGTATISRGFQFDLNSSYSVEVVLNSGTGMEIKSGKTTLSVARLEVLTDETSPQTADEVKFGNGSKAEKRYQIQLTTKDPQTNCSTFAGSVTIVDKTGTKITVPQDDTTSNISYGKNEYSLTFESSNNICKGKLRNTTNGETREKFIVTNKGMKESDIQTVQKNNAMAFYGGLGNAIRISMNTITMDVPIEPVGVIVLAIDGLRQDVLYETSQVNDPAGNYYINPSELKGICDILGGQYDSGFLGIGSGCDSTGWENRHIKLPNVTAIFPSITVASWASVFTGKLPNETGILGNEFYARDLTRSVPPKFDPPTGVITFGQGAFRGYDDYSLWNMLMANKDDKEYFFIPYQADWSTGMSTEKTPQNETDVLKADTVYESIAKSIPGVASYFKQKGGDPVVVANNHYARGAYWLTWDVEFTWGESAMLDKMSWDKLDDYLAGKYRSLDEDSHYYRNKTPFSALTVWYLPGPDHEAHIHGMNAYTDLIKSSTDERIKDVVTRLKELDEFENKIFIIVADHGHTAMPTDLTYTRTNVTGVDDVGNKTIENVTATAEMSCKLNLDFGFDSLNSEEGKNKRNAEFNNNNLHILELSEVMKKLNKLYAETYPGTDIPEKLSYKILGPSQIAGLYKNSAYGAKETLSEATVIAALNGPMAHIYIKDRTSSDWSTHGKIIDDVGYLAEVLRLLLSINKTPSNLTDMFPEGLIEYVLFDTVNLNQNMAYSIDAILIRKSVSPGEKYCVYKGIKTDKSDIECDSLQSYFSNSNYAKAVERINGMENPDRSGDIVLVMRDATTGNTIDRFTTGVACKSWHGSLNASDSYVPFILNYPGGNRFELESIVKKIEVCGSQMDCEGNWKITDLLKEIVKAQY